MELPAGSLPQPARTRDGRALAVSSEAQLLRALTDILKPGEVVTGRVVAALGNSAWLVALRGRTVVAEALSDLHPDQLVQMRIMPGERGEPLRMQLVTPEAPPPPPADELLADQRIAHALGLEDSPAAVEVVRAFRSLGAPLDRPRLLLALGAPVTAHPLPSSGHEPVATSAASVNARATPAPLPAAAGAPPPPTSPAAHATPSGPTLALPSAATAATPTAAPTQPAGSPTPQSAAPTPASNATTLAPQTPASVVTTALTSTPNVSPRQTTAPTMPAAPSSAPVAARAAPPATPPAPTEPAPPTNAPAASTHSPLLLPPASPQAHALLARADLPVTPLWLGVAQTALDQPDAAAALQRAAQSANEPTEQRLPPLPDPDANEDPRPALREALTRAGLGHDDGAEDGLIPARNESETPATWARHLAGLDAERALPPGRALLAERALPTAPLDTYERVIPLPLAEQGRPAPARLAVSRRPGGGLSGSAEAILLRLDGELSRLGPYSVRSTSHAQTPLGITIAVRPDSRATLSEQTAALAAALEHLGLDPRIRLMDLDDG